ncbi:MAG: 50S ribosomal protein L22 [Candidatus Marinimicrobia bacterium]|nr:50S ribosomal protein L22 [Candidatus Neomarinimicrobiota bacterium]MCH7851176.1 50S ribosomal protein L22 [Candidatus Neomarinimicrobiota bacterium]MCH7938492.1 50S ribosomal protein L22 [Candidatus Neomarinimicrobiota bacterium]MCH8024104.1 50S ribosomal protein L22 [Candidatus Neomarinimicrobiota bacterium]MCH8836431.1 50S ribosomal protein L22 [Candidatus Neomarinimicrobiota bacterium]
MEKIARARFLHQSPRKINRVLHMVRGEDVNKALNVLHFSPTKASVFVEKTLRSAIANMMNAPDAKEVDVDNLYVKLAVVDGGATLKRWRARAMGRANRILKRTSHLTLVVAEKDFPGKAGE